MAASGHQDLVYGPLPGCQEQIPHSQLDDKKNQHSSASITLLGPTHAQHLSTTNSVRPALRVEYNGKDGRSTKYRKSQRNQSKTANWNGCRRRQCKTASRTPARTTIPTMNVHSSPSVEDVVTGCWGIRPRVRQDQSAICTIKIAQEDATRIVARLDYPWRYHQDADQGLAYVQFSVGVLYEGGRDMAQSHSKALELYLKAADQGFAIAQIYVAVFHDSRARTRELPQGDGIVPQGRKTRLALMDYPKAQYWYRKAPEQDYRDSRACIQAADELLYRATTEVGAAKKKKKSLQPLRIAAMPNVTLDIVVDEPLNRTEAALPRVSSQTAVQDTAMETTVQDEATVPTEMPAHSTASAIITETTTTTVGRNPAFGLVEAAMQNYNHIDNPSFGPQPRAPQLIPSSGEDDSDDESTNRPHSCYGVKDISPIVVKATLGDIISQGELGNMHKVGDGVEQDYEAARYWYLKAANQGHAYAQCSVGDLYRLGLGIDFNHSKALSWYQKAANQGSASGQYSMGLMYEYGLAVEMHYAVAMYWYRKSADQGYAPAQCSIGELYSYGRGVSKDYSKAMEWNLLAAKQDLSKAYYNVGSLYHNGRGVAKDKDAAVEWLRKTMSHKDIDGWAKFFMGVAHEWLLKSARQGVPEAQVGIATLYLLGSGVPQVVSETWKWLRKAADQHLPAAQYAIGSKYRLGHGVPKDYSIAKEWYAKAARQEQRHAKKALVTLQQLMDKEEEKKLTRKEEDNLKKEDKGTLKKEENKEAGVGGHGVDNMTQRHSIDVKTAEVKKKQTSSRFKFW
ncbi:MAG: hypothetical protein J3R72DRAFT_495012 [Linnemannia gamsii]|nr:MAG: hypothetical protein J3R72DRAFT_495012 [Linnemannia gamsii]